MSKPDIGLRQGKLLCQMKHDERLAFFAEGLPIILDSARGFWAAAQQLSALPREADVLENHAEEEAAKILIVMDMVRCPQKLGASKMGDMVKWFYDHLARIIYANATSWKPMDMTQLREYVDKTRKAHYLEGDYGEYILPNFEISSRESRLYADIEAYEDRKPMWSAPQGFARSFPSCTPSSLALAEAFAALGIFRPEGLRATAEIWGALEFRDTQGFGDSRRLTKELIGRILEEKLARENAEQTHVDRIYNSWQLPMYNFDVSLTPVPLEQLQRERDGIFYDEMVTVHIPRPFRWRASRGSWAA
jgi:hypothetical protein